MMKLYFNLETRNRKDADHIINGGTAVYLPVVDGDVNSVLNADSNELHIQHRARCVSEMMVRI